MPKRQPKAERKPNEYPNSVFVTCAGKLRKKQIVELEQVLLKMIRRGILIFVSDSSPGDEHVVRFLNGEKYAKCLVWGHSGHCEVMTVFGRNYPAKYRAKERDLCAVARTKATVAVGSDERVAAAVDFAGRLGHQIREIS